MILYRLCGTNILRFVNNSKWHHGGDYSLILTCILYVREQRYVQLYQCCTQVENHYIRSTTLNYILVCISNANAGICSILLFMIFILCLGRHWFPLSFSFSPSFTSMPCEILLNVIRIGWQRFVYLFPSDRFR